MNLAAVVNVTAMAVVAACLASVVRANSIANRYGKQQLAQKQNRYGNAASSLPSLSWLNGGAGNRVADGWTSPYSGGGGGGGGNLMRHYPVSVARYPAAMMVDSRQGGAVYADDYYDGNAVSPYDPRLQLLQQYDGADDDRSDDYAVVRYPSYEAAGYYPLADFAAYDTAATGDDVLYDDMAIVPPASYYLQPSAAAAVNRYDSPPPPPPPRSPLSLSLTNRYEPAARYPTDKIHKFRKVFMSNVVSPSNAFKSTKEQQLYDFWESLVNDRGLDGIRMDDAETAGQRHQQPQPQQGRHAPVESSDTVSQLYQHLPPIFQQLLHKQQKQQQQQQQQQQQIHKPFLLQHQPQPADERDVSSPSSSSLSLASPSHAMAPTGSHYKQWANGSPLIKRGVAARHDDHDDVRQLEKLKTRNATAVQPSPVTTTTTVVMSDHVTTAAPMMADGGQREYVLPRPAGEKSGIESLLEVIAEGGLKGHLGENSYSKIREEAKVNKKRSFVSDETSLAAQLGALRKN